MVFLPRVSHLWSQEYGVIANPTIRNKIPPSMSPPGMLPQGSVLQIVKKAEELKGKLEDVCNRTLETPEHIKLLEQRMSQLIVWKL